MKQVHARSNNTIKFLPKNPITAKTKEMNLAVKQETMKALYLTVIFAIVGILQSAPAIAETVNLFTSNKKAAEITTTLNQHLLEIAPKKDKIKFISDGRYGLSTRSFPPWHTTFELPIGGMFTLKPKAGAWENFKVKEIQANGVLLEYEVGLSHQSVGNDILVKDSGNIFLKYK